MTIESNSNKLEALQMDWLIFNRTGRVLKSFSVVKYVFHVIICIDL